MTDPLGTAVLPAALPIVFNAAGAWCFGWFHAARTPARGIGVVMCRPMGYEANCAYRTYTQFAEKLANAGFDVLRFDYQGTGDSAGSDVDPDRLRAWLDSIISATKELRRLAGVSRLAFFGVRLGATLAAKAASELGGVESLVMWAPCVTGRAFARELRASSANRAKSGRTGDDPATCDIEALGHIYTAQTLQDLEALDCQRLDVRPAARVMIIGRDDMPGEGPLPAKYTAMGIDTSHVKWPGYCGMMLEPHESVVDHTTLGLIADWLSAAPPTAVAPLAANSAAAPVAIDPVLDGIREMPLKFGPDQSLFGILTEPAESSAPDWRSETGLLLLNVGGHHRIGPNRIYVTMARAWAAAGHRVFRIDLAGIGDSGSEAGSSPISLYEKDSTPEVRAAIVCLVARGCKKIVAMGVCSGGFVAFQTALVDARVTGLILMNPRLLEYQVNPAAGTLHAAMQTYYKSTHYYRSALLNLDVYRRILRGEVDVTGISKRFKVVIQARVKQTLKGLLQPGQNDCGLLGKLKQLCARGTDTLLIMAAEDDGRDYIDFHFGTRASRMHDSPNFRVSLVEDADHTFSRSHSRRFVIATVLEHLEKRASGEGPGVISPAAALTLAG